ncbi:helix-turn-helix domain-containing protein [Deinococcus koreensis]|uniref:helix-turn-helix domain-containing protein n=1 Tax=Deinococcus koreensis TaxID=2054903 RepID=UPI0010574D85|nr:helix-turn-helix transcriptional regulator [Deinococcus koreensis]
MKLVTAIATAAWRSATLAWDKALKEAELIDETIVAVNKVSSNQWMQDCKQYYQYFSQLYIRQFSHQPYGVGSPPGTTIQRKKQTTRKAKKPARLLREVLGANSRLVKIGKDLSINDAAAKANIDWSYFAQIERGERSVGLDVMDALAQADGVLLFELLDPSFQKLNELEQ